MRESNFFPASQMYSGFKVSADTIQTRPDEEKKPQQENAAPSNVAGEIAATPIPAGADAKTTEAAVAAVVDVSKVSVSYGASANKASVKDSAELVIKEILATAGETSCTITSTARTPEDQARAMYNNLETHGVEAQKKLYAAAGDQVIEVYVASKE